MIFRLSIIAVLIGANACDEEPEEFQTAFVVEPVHIGEDQVVGWSPSTPSGPEHTSSFDLSRQELLIPHEGRPLPFLVLLVRLGPSADLLVSVNDEPVAELIAADEGLDLAEAIVEVVNRLVEGLACAALSELGAKPHPFVDPENEDYFRQTPSLQWHQPVFVAVPWELLRRGRNQVHFELVDSRLGNPADQAILGYAAISSRVDGCALYFDLSSYE